MISYIVKSEKVNHSSDGFGSHREYRGLSTDTKPTEGVKNGDEFFEMDTKNVYLFDEDGQQWLKQ